MSGRLPAPLAAALRSAGLAASVKAAEPVPWATDAAVYRVDDAEGRAWAVRLRPRERLPDFERERDAMDRAGRGGVPVAQVRAVATVGAWSYMVAAWAPGVSAAEALARVPEDAGALGSALGRTQARLHRCPPPAAAARWLVPGDGIEARLLAAATAGANRPSLLHLDFHLHNVLWDGGRVGAVLDWTNAGAGDSRLDVARTRCLFAVAALVAGVSREAMEPVEHAWRAAYEAEAGALPDMQPALAWAAARTARDLATKLDPRLVARLPEELGRPW